MALLDRKALIICRLPGLGLPLGPAPTRALLPVLLVLLVVLPCMVAVLLLLPLELRWLLRGGI